MRARTALLRSADHIEAKPKAFNFWATSKPRGMGPRSIGCALGWLSYFLGVKETGEDSPLARAAMEVGAESSIAFYFRMDCLTDADWRMDAAVCAKALRRYANCYYPARRRKAA